MLNTMHRQIQTFIDNVVVDKLFKATEPAHFVKKWNGSTRPDASNWSCGDNNKLEMIFIS